MGLKTKTTYYVLEDDNVMVVQLAYDTVIVEVYDGNRDAPQHAWESTPQHLAELLFGIATTDKETA